MHRRQVVLSSKTGLVQVVNLMNQAEILVTSQTLVTVQTTVFVFSKYHVIWSFLNVFNALRQTRLAVSILESLRKIRMLCVYYSLSLPSRGRSYDIGFSSQLKWAMSGAQHMERECLIYSYWLHVACFPPA